MCMHVYLSAFKPFHVAVDRQAHYQTGNTPLALVWKDDSCSQYVIDTDNKGNIPSKQHLVLELQDNLKVTTSDDPPVEFCCMDRDFVQKV